VTYALDGDAASATLGALSESAAATQQQQQQSTGGAQPQAGQPIERGQ
jgi:hypothetical protein